MAKKETEKSPKLEATINKLSISVSKLQETVSMQRTDSKDTNAILVYLAISMVFFALAQILVSALTIKPENLANNALLIYLGLIVALYFGYKIALAAIKRTRIEDISIDWLPDVKSIFGWLATIVLISVLILLGKIIFNV